MAKFSSLLKRATGVRRGAILVDAAPDQGGCFETSHPTSYDEPTFTVDGRAHYCVANMPGGVPRTSTRARTNATLPYERMLAPQRFETLTASDSALDMGVNVAVGRITHAAVVAAFSELAV